MNEASPKEQREALFELIEVSKVYAMDEGFFSRARSVVRAVDRVCMDIREGQTLGLVGESGCGKSTLGRLILRLEEPDGGRILFRGEDTLHYDKARMKEFRREVQIIFQDPYSSLNPRHTVARTLGEPLLIHGIKDSDERDQMILKLIRDVGLESDHLKRYPHQFSGGQRQRVGIARALALRPHVIVCDEPVSALDVSIQAQIINLLQDLQEKYGLSYLFISHDLRVVRHTSNRVAVMYLGRVVEIARSEELFAEPLHPYTRALLSAAPLIGSRKKNRTILEGDVPSPANPPSGCHFHTRCPQARTLCAQEQPKIKESSLGHLVACHFPTS